MPQVEQSRRVTTRDDDHLHGGEFLADLPQGENSVLTRHENVRDHDGRRMALEQLHAHFALARVQYFVTFLFERASHDTANWFLIVDDDDPGHAEMFGVSPVRG